MHMWVKLRLGCTVLCVTVHACVVQCTCTWGYALTMGMSSCPQRSRAVLSVMLDIAAPHIIVPRDFDDKNTSLVSLSH